MTPSAGHLVCGSTGGHRRTRAQATGGRPSPLPPRDLKAGPVWPWMPGRPMPPCATRWPAVLGTGIESVTRWAGFDWRTNIALVGGFAAKEVIVSTLGTAYSLGAVDAEAAVSLAARLVAEPGWRTLTAWSLIDFRHVLRPLFCHGGLYRQGIFMEMGSVFHDIQHLAGFFTGRNYLSDRCRTRILMPCPAGRFPAGATHPLKGLNDGNS
jgi:hypothetical protein